MPCNPTSVRWARSSVIIAKGQSATVFGHLVDSQSSRDLAGFHVALFARTSTAKPYVQIAALTTSANGRVSQVVTPNYTTHLLWLYAGSSVHAAATSPVTTVTIGIPPTQLTITNGLTITKGESTTVFGHLVNAQTNVDLAGLTVELFARTSSSDPWTKLKTLITSSAGRVSQVVTPNYSTELQWRFAGSPTQASAVSPTITVTVN